MTLRGTFKTHILASATYMNARRMIQFGMDLRDQEVTCVFGPSNGFGPDGGFQGPGSPEWRSLLPLLAAEGVEIPQGDTLFVGEGWREAVEAMIDGVEQHTDVVFDAGRGR